MYVRVHVLCEHFCLHMCMYAYKYKYVYNCELNALYLFASICMCMFAHVHACFVHACMGCTCMHV